MTWEITWFNLYFLFAKGIEVISRDVVIIENPFHALTIPLYYLLYPLN